MRGHAGIIPLALLALICGCSSEAPSGSACVDDDARCGDACNSSLPCGHGMYCGDDGRCGKECVVQAKAGEASGCGKKSHCDANGTCVANPTEQMVGQEIPGGHPNGSGGSSGTSDASTASFDASNSPCQRTKVNTSRVMPTVILIVDQSGSMTATFGSGDRWNVLRDFLLGDDGLIASLQKKVRFGLALYSAHSMDGGPLPVGECPLVTTVEPAFDNFDAIAAVYRENEPLDDTPTGDSIDKVVETFGLDATSGPDATTNPVVFVLATDGEPDRCEELDPQTDAAKQESIDAVTRAFKLGIRTYVISVGDEVSVAHQQAIANAGIGQMTGDPEAEYWTAGDDASLRTALTSIVSAQLSCEIALNGTVAEGTECDGTVTLNGAELECNGTDGWKLLDPKHIELSGEACKQLKGSEEVALDVSFPCTFTVD